MSGTIEEIVVTGTRGGISFDWDIFDFDFNNVDYYDEDDSGGVSQTVDTVAQQSTQFVEVVMSNGLKVKADLNAMPEASKEAFLYLANNLDKFPGIKKVFDDLKALGLNEVQIVSNPDGVINPNVSTTDVVASWSEYSVYIGGPNTEGGVAGATGVANGVAIININPHALDNTIPSFAIQTLIHEFVHAADMSLSEAQTTSKTQSLIDELENNDPDYESEINGYGDAEHGVGSSAGNTMNGGAGHDHIEGNGGNDTLYGKGGNDLLVGGIGNDVLYGSSGNDELVAGSGYDQMYGGGGNDKYVIDVNMYGGIGDAGGSDDYLEIQISSSVSFDRVSSKLLITDNNTGQSLTIWNWFNGQEIENISLANGNVLSSAMINQIIEIQNGGGGYLPPIVLDLDGDGLELTSRNDSKTKIDLDDDGKKDETGWVSADDGILVFDQNGNGKVDGVDEFRFTQFGENSATDLQGLASFDENGDGLITSEDSIWGQLLVWQDQNQNGKSSDKELSTLDELGITSISVVSDEELRLIEENVVFGTSQFTRADGTVGIVGDVALQSDIYGYEWQENSDLYNKIVDFFN